MMARTSPAPSTSIFRPALLLMTGRTIGFAASFCIPVVLARIFDQAEFGTYKQFFLVAMTLYGIGQLGMAESLFYFLPQSPARAGRYAANSTLALLGGGLVCLALLGVAGNSVSHWLRNPDLERYMPLLAVYTFLLLTAAPLEIVMISRKQYRRAAGTYASLDVLRAAFLILPPLLVPELSWLLLGAVGFAAVRCATALWYVRQEFGTELRPDFQMMRAQFAYALPFQLAAMVEMVNWNLHQYAVAYHVDAASFAVYSVGCLQIPLVEFVISAVVNVMMVRMAEELRDGRRETAVAVWHDSARKLSMLFFPLVVLLLVAARPIIVFLFTERYAQSVPIFMVASLAMLMPAFAVDGVLRVHADTRFLFVLNVLRLVITLALIGVLIKALGLPGAILTTVLAGATAKAVGIGRIARLMGLRASALLPWGTLGRILGVAVAAGLPALLVRMAIDLPAFASLVMIGTVYGAAYVGLLLGFRVLSDAERRTIRGMVERWVRVATTARSEADDPCVESRE
jgi:O-antigen/teichoic acid export membrane protein